MEKRESLKKCTADNCYIYKTDRCHVKTKGSGGSFNYINIITLCRNHHIEQHQIGWYKFTKKYPSVMEELSTKGWYFENINGVIKLFNRNQDII